MVLFLQESYLLKEKMKLGEALIGKSTLLCHSHFIILFVVVCRCTQFIEKPFRHTSYCRHAPGLFFWGEGGCGAPFSFFFFFCCLFFLSFLFFFFFKENSVKVVEHVYISRQLCLQRVVTHSLSLSPLCLVCLFSVSVSVFVFLSLPPPPPPPPLPPFSLSPCWTNKT